MQIYLRSPQISQIPGTFVAGNAEPHLLPGVKTKPHVPSEKEATPQPVGVEAIMKNVIVPACCGKELSEKARKVVDTAPGCTTAQRFPGEGEGIKMEKASLIPLRRVGLSN